MTLIPMKKSAFPSAQRALEFVAFFHVVVPTGEGPGFVFLAVDAFSQYAFQLGVEPDASADSVLRCIRRLLSDAKFVSKAHRGFTLVLGDHKSLSDAIAAVIEPSNGRVLIDREFNAHLSKPVIESLGEWFLRGGEK